MVKLIRLLGDSEKSSSEIRNTFRQGGIMLKPYSKVALVGASALLTDTVVNENFVIDAKNSQFKIGKVSVDARQILNAEITTGSYSGHEFISEFEIAANYSGTLASGVGLHHKTKILNNRFDLTTHYDPLADAAFDNVTKWEVVSGNTSVKTATAITASGDLVIRIDEEQTACIPMVHSQFKATLLDCSGKDVAIYATNENAGTIPWGVEVTSGTYFKVIDGTSTSLATSWAANDVVTMDVYAGNLRIKIDASGGSNKITSLTANAVPRRLYGPLTNAQYSHLRWWLELSNGAALTNCECTILFNVDEKNVLLDSDVHAELQFKDSADKTNTLLATYCGFGLNGGSAIKYYGNPANVQGRDELTGLPSYPGILVTIDGLGGSLQSYDGADSSKAQDNILYVVNDLSVINNNQLQLDIPAPFFLDIGNSVPINITELRARFLPAAGQKVNSSLEFSGKPSLALLIDG
jgi:hypothetical protein